MGLLELLKPAYWFSAHLHVKFAALFKHNGQRTKVQTNFNNGRNGPQPIQPADAEGTSGNPDELVIDDDDDDAVDEDPAHHHAEAGPAPADALIHPQQPQPGSADTLADPDGPDESVDVKAGDVGNSDEIIMSNDDTQTPAITATAETNGGGSKNPDEIAMDDEEEEEEDKGATEAPAQQAPREHVCKCNCEAESTHFLALSKCLPGQDFLQVCTHANTIFRHGALIDVLNYMQILDVAAPDQNPEVVMTYDPAWLAITRAFHPQLSLTYQQSPLPRESTICKGMIEKEVAWIKANLANGGNVPVTDVQQFQQTAPYPGQPGGDERGPGEPKAW
jgi:lariat debranching enzyme